MNNKQSFTSQRNGFTSNSGNRNNDRSNTSYSSSGRFNNHDGEYSQCSNPDRGHNSREIDRLQNEVCSVNNKYEMEKSKNEKEKEVYNLIIKNDQVDLIALQKDLKKNKTALRCTND